MALKQEYSIDRLEVRTLVSLDYGTAIEVGVDGTGYDFKFYGDTTGAYALWDYSADMFILDGADLKVNDNDKILFGDATAGDVAMYWDATALVCAPVTGFWAGCPTQVYADPSVAYFYAEDFIGFQLDTNNEPTFGWKWYENIGATTAEATGSLGGVLLMTTHNNDNDDCAMQLGHAGTETFIEYSKNSGLKSWVEFRVAASQSGNNFTMFIGLAEEGSAVVDFIVDAGNDFVDKDLIGFVIWEAAGAVVDIVHQFKTGGFADVGEAIVDHTDTMHTYGIYFDGVETVTFYVDNTIVGTADVDTVTFPEISGAGEELSPIIYLKTHSEAAKSMSIDWIKMVVER